VVGVGASDVQVPARLSPTFAALEASVWATNDPVLLDLCRIRLGQLVGRDLPPRHAPPEQAAALRRWPTDPAFSPAERAALDFCEHYAIDARTVTDEQAALLHDHYDEPTLAALTTGIAFFDALVRVANAQES
jgi:alkylhydroperoxidase family enzyme